MLTRIRLHTIRQMVGYLYDSRLSVPEHLVSWYTNLEQFSKPRDIRRNFHHFPKQTKTHERTFLQELLVLVVNFY